MEAATIAERSLTSGSASLRGSDTAQNYNFLASTVGRLMGAKIGSYFGSALVAAGVFGRFANKLVTSVANDDVIELLVRTISEENVMRTMLMKPTSQAAQDVMTRRLRGHLANIALEDDSEFNPAAGSSPAPRPGSPIPRRREREPDPAKETTQPVKSPDLSFREALDNYRRSVGLDVIGDQP